MISTVKNWVALSRPPFHIVGILPFLLGTIVAWCVKGIFSLEVFFAGVTGSVLIMLAAYYAGEYWDIREDQISLQLDRNRFSGGSGVVASGTVSARSVLIAANICLLLAGFVGVLLVLIWHTGPWTVPLGVIGMVGGFYYSSRPLRFVSTGVGELWIAFCFGWLPVATSYYLQVGEFSLLINGISIPVAITIFNVILMNEFPDYPADTIAGKRNLAVRLGLSRSAALYGLVVGLSWIVWLLSPAFGVPEIFLWFQLPVLLLSIILFIAMIKGKWRNRIHLEWLCGGTLMVNGGICVAYIASFILM